MSENKSNPNLVSSEQLFIDENEVSLERRMKDSRTILSLADKALPLERTSRVSLNKQDSLAIEAKETVESVKAFFASDSELILNEGLRSMEAKLSKAEYCDNSTDMQALEFVMRFNDLSKENERPDLHDRMVTTVSYLRAAKMAKEKLSEEKGHLFVNADDVSYEVNSNPKYLETAYKELQNDHARNFNEFLDFVKEKGQKLEDILSQTNSISEHVVDASENLANGKAEKDTVIGDDVDKLDQCMKDAQLIQLAMIPTPYDEVVDVLDLPEKEATAYALEQAYIELARFGSHSSRSEDMSEFSVDHGLRALNDKLGDTNYHGPRYDIQLMTFALRFNQLVEEEGKNPDMKNRIKNVATYMRSAKIAEHELEKTRGFFVSSTEIAEKANAPEILQRAWNELSAYDDAMFNEFYSNMKRLSGIMATGFKAAEKHPEWRTF